MLQGNEVSGIHFDLEVLACWFGDVVEPEIARTVIAESSHF